MSVPDTAMSVPDAALLYERDGYNVTREDLKGRHVVGDGFLRAVVAAASDEPVRAYVSSRKAGEDFASRVRGIRPAVCVETIAFGDFRRLSRTGTLYLPGPGVGDHAFLRSRCGAAAYSIVGVTHTISSHRAMEAIAALMTAPTMPWDALVCTSRAVRDAADALLSAQADYLSWRFGRIERPLLAQLPVIPLGVHAADFAPDPAARARARAALGLDEDTVLAVFVGRLSFHAKAHPHAMYRALERVAQETGRKLALLQCGYFATEGIAGAFRTGAARFCPAVRALFADGRDPAARRAAFLAGDIFVSLSDNHQETFGLTPLEGMAAGLPVVVTDWDGYRDTVRDGVDGFRVPTFAPAPDTASGLDLDHETGTLNYDRYIGNAAMAVAVDHDALAARLRTLVEAPELRRRMGEAGRARVAEAFDWAVVHRLYRALYDDLAAMRAAEAGRAAGARVSPVRPDPYRVFARYPTAHVGSDTLVEARGTIGEWRGIAGDFLFGFAETLAKEEEAAGVLGALSAGPLTVAALCERTGMAPSRGRIVVCQMMKAGVLAVAPPQGTGPARALSADRGPCDGPPRSGKGLQ